MVVMWAMVSNKCAKYFQFNELNACFGKGLLACPHLVSFEDKGQLGEEVCSKINSRQIFFIWLLNKPSKRT